MLGPRADQRHLCREGLAGSEAACLQVVDEAYGNQMVPCSSNRRWPQRRRASARRARARISYFRRRRPGFPHDHGFATKNGRSATSRTPAVFIAGDTATTMGNVRFTDKDGKVTVVDKTWEFREGQCRQSCASWSIIPRCRSSATDGAQTDKRAGQTWERGTPDRQRVRVFSVPHGQHVAGRETGSTGVRRPGWRETGAWRRGRPCRSGRGSARRHKSSQRSRTIPSPSPVPWTLLSSLTAARLDRDDLFRRKPGPIVPDRQQDVAAVEAASADDDLRPGPFHRILGEVSDHLHESVSSTSSAIERSNVISRRSSARC